MKWRFLRTNDILSISCFTGRMLLCSHHASNNPHNKIDRRCCHGFINSVFMLFYTWNLQVFFCVLFLRGVISVWANRDMCLVKRIFTAGGHTPPAKRFFVILTADENFIWSLYFRFFAFGLTQLAITIVMFYIKSMRRVLIKENLIASVAPPRI